MHKNAIETENIEIAKRYFKDREDCEYLMIDQRERTLRFHSDATDRKRTLRLHDDSSEMENIAIT